MSIQVSTPIKNYFGGIYVKLCIKTCKQIETKRETSKFYNPSPKTYHFSIFLLEACQECLFSISIVWCIFILKGVLICMSYKNISLVVYMKKVKKRTIVIPFESGITRFSHLKKDKLHYCTICIVKEVISTLFC